MNKSKEIQKNYTNELHSVIFVIFIISLTIVILANKIYFSTGINFNLENFLMLLPFNLIGLSISLYVVMIILYNIAKSFI